MTEQSAQPAVDMERMGYTPLERIRALETRADDHERDINSLAKTFADYSKEFDKVKARITLATGAIIGISLVLKIVPPEVGEMLKHLFAG